MNFKPIINYISLAGIVFAFTFSYLQTLHLGFEKPNMILTIKGKNIEGINISFSNRYSKNFALDTIGLKNKSRNTIRFNIPEFAYIRNLQLTFKSDIGYKLHKIVFSGNNNRVSINKSDFNYFFRVPNYTYSLKTSTFKKTYWGIRKSNDLIINSIDLSDLLKNINIKSISIFWKLIISIFFSLISVLLYHFALVKVKEVSKPKLLFAVLILLLTLFTVQAKYYSTEIDEKLLDDSNSFSFIKSSDQNNLVYNGDFKHGLLFWEAFADSTTLELINTPFGKGVKIYRGDGNGGYWSLRYIGRPILYHQNHTYQILFKYKILNGKEIPFNIGWWITKNGIGIAHRLKITSTSLIDNWYNAESRYTFLEDKENPACFLNSLKDYSEVCIADIKIYDLNRDKEQIDYLDQVGN